MHLHKRRPAKSDSRQSRRNLRMDAQSAKGCVPFGQEVIVLALRKLLLLSRRYCRSHTALEHYPSLTTSAREALVTLLPAM